MTEIDVRGIFASKIKGDEIKLLGGSTVEVETFAGIFADAPSSPTYNDLMIIDTDTRGYKPFFDECKNEGVLS